MLTIFASEINFLFKEVEITPLVSIGVKQTVTSPKLNLESSHDHDPQVEEKYHPANPGVTLYWDNLQQGVSQDDF